MVCTTARVEGRSRTSPYHTGVHNSIRGTPTVCVSDVNFVMCSVVQRISPLSLSLSLSLSHTHTHSYCGHGTGREYLHLDGFQLLSCQASTLLMGCSSGRLVVSGQGDPTGMALNYLISGWSVDFKNSVALFPGSESWAGPVLF